MKRIKAYKALPPQNTVNNISNILYDRLGVKLNIHDIFASKLEALLTRADKSLNDFIYELYK